MRELFRAFAEGRGTVAEPGFREMRDEKGRSLLHVCNHPAGVKALLEAGLDPNAATPEGKTPLMSYLRDPEVNRLLLAAGADPNARDGQGLSPLDWQSGLRDGAIGYCAPDFAALDLLVEAGAEKLTPARAREWIDNAWAQVCAAIEAAEAQCFQAWTERHTKN